ncbi:MAG: amino acid adenylation domain-containing protein [Steroidobacterales bacterium]
MALAVPPDLTVAQAAIWFDQQLYCGRPIYNTGQTLAIPGLLRADLFERALRETVAESPGLQLPPRSARLQFELPRLDFRRQPDPIAAAEQWMQSEMRVPIALQDPLLFCFALIRVADDLTIWFQKCHHIIIDGTGRRRLSERTACRYRALRDGVAVPALEAATPAAVLDAERRYAASDSHEVDRTYWLQRFAHRSEPLLEGNRQDSERGRSGCQARLAFTLKRADFARLESAARALGSTASRAIIALTYAAFARLYDRSDIVLGIELAHRSGEAEKQMVGILARPLALPLNFDPGLSIADVIRELEAARARDYPHRRFPVQELVTALGIMRQGQHGLVDIVINFMPDAYDFAFEDAPVRPTSLFYGFAAPWLVTIAATGPMGDFDVTIDTDPGLISADAAARLAACVETLLLRGLQDHACSLSRLPIMPVAAEQQLLHLAAGKAVTLPEAATLTTLCQAMAEHRPDAVALIFGEQRLSFASLHRPAARLARRLAAVGVGPGVVVGIALPRTPALIVAVLAVHKAGGAYLALDPSYPAERIRFIVADAGAPVIVTNAALAPAFADSGARLLFDDEPPAAGAEMVEPVPARPGDLAYVLYTSGSTGQPKAVGIEHRNLVNLIHWGRSLVSDAELGGLLFSTSLNFDLSAFEMFLPLAFGGCIVMVDNLLALQAAPQREQVRLVNTGPSLINALLRTGGLPSGVTTVILAGEKLPRHLANLLFEAAPGVRLLNCYGPTETTVYSSCAVIDPAAVTEPTIGRAIWNTTLHVLNSTRALLPLGAEGELFIGGAGVARGYLGRSALTAERFLSNPHAAGRLYRTGDRVRLRPDGELEFLGRIDGQMKINGVRVEPGEIEAALLTVPGISAAAVALWQDAGVRRLTAYLVPAPGQAPDTRGVLAALERRLPRYMVPSCCVWLGAMPLTPNGKLDRKALPAPPREATGSPADQAPQTRFEREIFRIWEDVLGSPPSGTDADFFDLGGDSLALLNLFATIEARFGRRLSVDVLAGGLTVAKLAQLLAADEAPPAARDPVVALQPLGQLPPFFCVPGIGGEVLQLHRLGVHLGTDRPLFAFRWTPETCLTATVSEIAAPYVAAMLAVQPAGPFYLGGYCLGAVVAYEIARQLKEQGHEIGMLAIIDQRNPAWRLTLRGSLPALYHTLVNSARLVRDEWDPLGAARWIIGGIGRKARKWSRRLLGLRPAAAAAVDPGRALHEQMRLPGEAYLPALRSYRPEPSTVPIALFRALVTPRQRLPLDHTLGWSALAQGEVTVHKVAGDHISITTEPHVRDLAKALSETLDAAQRVPRRNPSTASPRDTGPQANICAQK